MPRPRAKPRELATKGMVRTTRVRLREMLLASQRGHCEQCEVTEGLEGFWRTREDRPLGTIQAYWLAGAEIREELADKVIVLCAEHMRLHKGGVPHGGGVAGVHGCGCIPCKQRRREYVKGKHRQYRASAGGS